MKKVSIYKEIMLCLFIMVLAYFFPFTGTDYFWANLNIENIKEFVSMANGNLIPSLFTLVLTKVDILRIVSYGILFYILITLIRATISKRNAVLSSLMLFLLLLMDRTMFASNVVNLTNFMTNILSTVVLLIFYGLFTKNSLDKLKPIETFLIGLFGCMINPIVTFTVLSITIYYLHKTRKKSDFKKAYLLVGEILGTLMTVLSTNIRYNDFFHNLFYNFISTIKGSNFLITFILTVLVLLESFKLLKNKRKVKPLIAIAGLISFLIVSIIEVPNVIYYVALIAYMTSTYYVLINANRKTIFKTRIFYWFAFKISYLFFILTIGSTIESHMFYPIIMDILLIIEIYDYAMPKNYLSFIWTFACLVLLASDIYIYRSVYKKYDDLTDEIKYKLEVLQEEYVLPARYKTEYLYDYIPNTQQKINWYVDYYGLDKDRVKGQYVLHFKE